MEFFSLDREFRFVVYGAAFMGRRVLNGLNKAGYRVDAFLDKQAEKFGNVNGIKVYKPNEYEHRNFESTVVVVAITNPFEHVYVADYVRSLGYDKIIFRLTEDMMFSEDAFLLSNSIYDKILEGDIDENSEFFFYNSDMLKMMFEDGCYISGDESYVVAYVPTDLCFSDNWADNSEGITDKIAARSDLPVFMSHYELVNFFASLNGSNLTMKKSFDAFAEMICENPGFYNNIYPSTPQGISDLLTNRSRAFWGMHRSLQKGMDFFINHPIELYLNKNHFQCSDGHHRICFFLAMGLPFIPARMTRSDYERWLNKEHLSECIEFAGQNHIYEAYIPILHPNFYFFPRGRDLGGVTRLRHFGMFFQYNNFCFKNRRVVDIGSYYGYLSQFFARLGAEVTAVEYDKESSCFGELLNKLLYCDNVRSICGSAEELDPKEKYSVSVMLTVLYWHLDTPTGLALIKKVDEITEDILLWESGGEPEREKKFIFDNSSFTKYIRLAETSGSGLMRELGVFCKEHISFGMPYWIV